MSKYSYLHSIIDNNISKLTTRQIIDLIVENYSIESKSGLKRYTDKRKLKYKTKLIKTTSETLDNVLIIPDLHLPFKLSGYLTFAKETYKKFDCTKVVFIGDLIDNCASSYHELNPNGMSASLELDTAIEQLQEWYEAFPIATVINGNHDILPNRKVKTSGLDKRWIKQHKNVLGTPDWEFVDELIHNNILYTHGHVTKEAYQECLYRQMPVVSGHRHTHCYIRYQTKKLWGMQTGIAFNKNVYAFDYSKGNVGQQVEAIALVLGNVPVLIPYN